MMKMKMKMKEDLILTLVYLFSCFLVSHSQNVSATASTFPRHLCLGDQSHALLQLKQEFPSQVKSSFYLRMKSWKASSDCCFWEGVTCNFETGHVVSLNLSNSGLHGPLSSNSSLFKLYHLQKLDLSVNNFSFSPIPHTLGRLTSLTHLYLSSSMLTGQIPSEISWLTHLVSLDLSYSNLIFSQNNFKALLHNVTNLRELHLDAVDIPSLVLQSLANLSSLTYLSLEDCYFRGDFPADIFLLPNIQSISLFFNPVLKGFLPEFHPNSSLRVLDLSQTNFSGEIPKSIGNIKSLNIFKLGYCQFSGTIPSTVGNLSHLTVLDFGWNSFNGDLPSTIWNLGNLESLILTNNQLEGELHYSLGSLNHLESLDLSNNNLHGQIPDVFANLSKLSSLSLSGNNLHGQIPDVFANLSKLSSLSLSSNQLIGSIPPSLFTMASLSMLDLSANQFSGTLNFDNNVSSTQLAFLFLGENKLNGPIPRSMSKLVGLEYLWLQSNNLSGEVDFGIFSELQNLSYLDLSNNNISVTSLEINYSLPVFLVMSSCNLREFPNFLRNLKNITGLDLSNNKIHGPIPKFFWSSWKNSLSYLDLSHNFITGMEEAPTILPWKKLSVLHLQSNLLQGPLPILPLTISVLLASKNNLTGNLSIFCNLNSLFVLDLSNNNFEGSIPPCLGKFSKRLQVLNLHKNNLHGSMPHTFTKECNLGTLDLSHNQLQGKLARSLIKCKKLEVLNIGYNQISDTFPFWLENLPELLVLVLKSNNFYGPIWHSHYSFAFIKLRIIDISFNSFVGEIPPEHFKNLTAMKTVKEKEKSKSQYLGDETYYYHDSISLMGKGIEMFLERILTIFISLDFSNNKFQGKIPSSIMDLQSLLILNLSNNSFTGNLSIFCNLSSLEVLDLSNNNFKGSIPPCLGKFSKHLRVLNLHKNNLHGSMPRTFTKECNLGTLDLSHNQLQGTLARSLIRCKKLENLNIGYNQINDTFPFWLENFLELQVLVLKSNNFHGPIWHSHHSFAFIKLRIIDISFNSFVGEIPSEHFKNLTAMKTVTEKEKSKLQYMGGGRSYYHDSISLMGKGIEMHLERILTIFTSLDFSNNKFQGKIPSSIMDLQPLLILNLSNNSFTGNIPSSFGKMTELESLDLSDNNLSGTIPKEFTSLTFLEYLNVSNNKLSGPIPQGGQIQTFPKSSFEGNPTLCGSPLLKKCENFETQCSKENPESASRKGILDWKGVVMGYGCGVIVGFIGGYTILSKRQNYWFVRIYYGNNRWMQRQRRHSS